MVRLTDCLDMTIVVDWDVKPQMKQTNITGFLVLEDHIHQTSYLRKSMDSVVAWCIRQVSSKCFSSIMVEINQY